MVALGGVDDPRGLGFHLRTVAWATEALASDTIGGKRNTYGHATQA